MKNNFVHRISFITTIFRGIAILSIIIFISCSTIPTKHPDTIKINCSGASSNWEECYHEAFYECDGYFTILRTSDIGSRTARKMRKLRSWKLADDDIRYMIIVCEDYHK